jgi:hypothetical protein
VNASANLTNNASLAAANNHSTTASQGSSFGASTATNNAFQTGSSIGAQQQAATSTTNNYATNSSIGAQQQAAVSNSSSWGEQSAEQSAASHSTTASNDFATSTAATDNLQASDNFAHSSTTNDTLALTYMGPTTIGHANADNIAVDGSTINSTSTAALNLMGSSESSASGVNIVNAVGSMVANGVNIGFTSNMNAMPSLTQTNTIVQSH